MRFMILICLVAVALAYPTGPPVIDGTSEDDITLCKSMFPVGHNVTAQTIPVPFTVTFQITGGKSCFNKGDELIVTVGNDSLTFYEGVFIQAKKAGDNSKNYGTFNTNNNAELKTLPCFGKADSALSQGDKAHYYTHIVKWTADDTLEHDIEFVATIVHETDQFWTNVKSPKVASCDAVGAGSVVTASFLTLLIAAVASWL